MANTTIKITQLQNIGNGLAANTLLPVVNTSGTAITQKVTVGNVANFALSQAGNTLAPAFLANLAYSVVNAAQPNITSVGTLNVNTLKISGGTNGYVLQTDGAGNLAWTAQTGGGGNGSPGGSNSQLQFNLNGSFSGDPDLTWDAGNNKLTTINLAATTANISGNVNTANVSATGNIRTNAIYTDNYYYANGVVFGGGNGTPGGSNTQIQFNDGGAFAGNTGFTFNKTTGVFSSPFLAGNGNGLSNIQGANVSGAVNLATFAGTANAVAGANVSGQVSFAGTANSVAVANVVGIGNIATVSLNGNGSQFLRGNGTWGAGGANTGNFTFNGYTMSAAEMVIQSSNGFIDIQSDTNVSILADSGNAQWMFNANSTLTSPDGTYTTGSTITVPTGGTFEVTTSSPVSVSAAAFTGSGSVFTANTEDNDDITAVQVGWRVNAGGTTYTVTAIDPSPPINRYIITAAGANFVTGTTYTFNNPVPAEHTWSINQYGVLTTPGNGTISQINNDFFISVANTDIIGLRTEGGDVIVDAAGNLNIPGELISTTSVSRLSLNEQGGGGAYLTSTDDDSTALFLRTTDIQMYAGVNQTITAGTILPGLETDYSDSRLVLEDLFTQNEGLPGYPWGITLPVSYLTYNQLILLSPGTFPNQAACTVQANNTNNRYELWQDTIADTNVTITANENNWVFDSAGDLSAPGNIDASFVRVVGGLVSQGSSPAPYISGFSSISTITSSSVNEGNITAGRNIIANVAVISRGNISAEGNVSANFFIGNGSLLTGITANANLGNLAIDNNNIFNSQGLGVIISNFNFVTDEAETAYVQIPAGNSNSDLSVVQEQGNVRLVANTAGWNFDTSGNLTLPTNSSSINYANGQPYGGGGNISALVNDGNSFVLDADGSVTFEGADPGEGVNRGLEWDYGANANGVNSMVRQDNNGLTVRAWTEQGGGANGYSAPVRVVTNQDATEKEWVFDGAGNLTMPGNLRLLAGNIQSNIISPAFTSGITSVDVSGNANVTITVSDELFEEEISGRVTISDVNAPVQVNGIWWYQAIDFDRFQLYSDANLTTPVDGSSWPAYAGPGGTAVGIIAYSDLTVQAGNVSISSNAKDWLFDTAGNLTVPGSINAIDDGGQLGAQVQLIPDLGVAKLAGRNALSNVGYTNTAWSTATYTGTQIDFTNAPDLVTFFNDNQFNVGVNQTFSINGGEPVPFTGYTTGVSNAVTVYTSVTADPDPTTVTSIDFYYQLESYVSVDYDAGALRINATGLTINLDNDQTSGPDINLRSGDDITLQGKDKALGSESEGGDINIYGGDGGDDDGLGNNSASGGDIQIVGGAGGSGNTGSGSSGGFARLQSGDGGDAGVTNVAGSGGYIGINAGAGGFNNGNAQLGAQGGYVEITAGQTTLADGVGGYVEISSGTAAEGNGIAGNVVIRTPISATGQGGNWTYDGQGNLTLPNGNPYIKTSDEESTITISVSGAANNRSQFSIGSDGGTDQYTYISSQNDTNGIASFGLNAYSGVPTSAVISINNGTVLDWTFSSAALDPSESFLYIPNGGAISTPNATGGEGGKNIFIQAGASDPVTWNSNPGGELMLKGGYGSFGDGGGGPGGNVNIEGGPSSDSHAGNVNISSGLNTWTFDYNGNLTVPGNLIYTGASPAPSIRGFSSVSAVQFTNGTSNVTVNANSNLWTFDSTGNLTIPGSSGGVIKTVANGAIAIAAIDNGSDNPSQLLSINANGTATTAISSYANQATIQANINGDIKTWAFTNTGNLVLPGNTFSVNYANGTQVSLGGGASAPDFTPSFLLGGM